MAKAVVEASQAKRACAANRTRARSCQSRSGRRQQGRQLWRGRRAGQQPSRQLQLLGLSRWSPAYRGKKWAGMSPCPSHGCCRLLPPQSQAAYALDNGRLRGLAGGRPVPSNKLIGGGIGHVNRQHVRAAWVAHAAQGSSEARHPPSEGQAVCQATLGKVSLLGEAAAASRQ